MANQFNNKVSKISLLNDPPPGSSLRELLTTRLTNVFISFFNSVFGEVLNGIYVWLETITATIYRSLNQLSKDIIPSPLHAELSHLLGQSEPSTENLEKDVWNLVKEILSLAGFFVTAITSAGEPYANLLKQDIEKNLRSQLLTANDYVTALVRFSEYANKVYENLQKLGYTDFDIGLLKRLSEYLMSPEVLANAVARRLLTIDQVQPLLRQNNIDETNFLRLVELAKTPLALTEIFELWNRGEISEDSAREWIQRLGFYDEQARVVEKLRFNIPPIQDLIRFAVRDAFNQQAVERFGYDEEYPEQLEVWLEKQGYDKSWLRAYWRAHWDLPSPQQAYEMLHRNVIDKDELELLLKIADYPKFWRDKLIAISYNPYTRVDIRRMYQLGVLTLDEVKEAYQAIGYDDVHAEKLTLFTQAQIKESGRDLSKSEILSLFESGLINDERARFELKKLKYSDEEIDLLLNASRIKSEKTVLNDRIKAIQLQYNAELLDEQQAISKLVELGLTVDSANAKVELFAAQKQSKVELPSVNQLKDFFLDNIIDLDQFQNELKLAGWQADYIAWFVSSVLHDKTNKQQQQLQNELKEQQRLASVSERNTYRVQVNQINIQIAESKARIAEIELALFETSDVDLADKLNQEILELKKHIADLQVAKTKIPLALEK